MLYACAEGAWPFIETWFHDCVYSIKDCTGFTLGMTAIVLWITAQLPQFLDNIKNQSADALSVWFLAQWFLGDTLNLLGCLMSGEQLPTTTALAMYFVLSDVCMLTQFVYFGALQRRKAVLVAKEKARKAQRRAHHQRHMRSSGIVGLMSDGTLRQPARAGAASFSHPPMRAGVSSSFSQPPVRHSIIGVQQPPGASPSRHAHFATPQQQQLLQQAASGSGPSGLRACPGVSNAVVAAAAAGSILSLVALGVTMTSGSQGQGWRAVLHESEADPVCMGHGGSGDHRHHAWGHHEDNHQNRPWWEDTDELLKFLGTLCGSLSTGLYLSSRLSQIYKNWSRKSAEGLSVVMFLFTICANLCTGSSILLRLKDAEALKAQLPWVLGAFGTVGLDMFIARQAVLYNRINHQAAAGAAASHDAETGAGTSRSVESTNPLLQPLIE